MTSELAFDLNFEPVPGEPVRVSDRIRRVVAPNPGPFTFRGTSSYIVGAGRVAILDPGPDIPSHVEALLDAVRGETVTHVVVSHTHRDHSPAARTIGAATGAPIVGCGPHRSARALGLGEANPLEASADGEHRPDREMAEGDVIEGPGWRLAAVETPGHTANHLCFALLEEGALFSADHVMAWSTSIVAPPDGAMGPYMASLEKLRSRSESVYWPGHGGPVRDPGRFVRGLIGHRRAREASILKRLASGDRTIPAIVRATYQGLAPALVRAAGLSVMAHLEDLVGRGLVATDGPPRLDGTYRLP